jgi:prevent-host-death family protein
LALIDTADLVSISDANRLGVSALIRQAEAGRDQVLVRNSRPVAAVVSMGRLEEIQQLEEDLADVSLLAARMLFAGVQRHSLDDVLARFGYTRDQLRSSPD